jgi:flagellar hook assembly protein FlgD
MTVSGKLVREIRMAELGPLRIGNNVTQYVWDGTDEYGDRLANGVYYYRVFTKLHGEQIDHRSSDADNLFKKGYGKMVLIR